MQSRENSWHLKNRPKWRLSTSNLWRPYKPVYQSSVGFWLAERIIEAQNRHKHDNFNGISPKLWKSSQLCLPNSVGFLTRSKSHKNSEIPIPQSQSGRHFSRQNNQFTSLGKATKKSSRLMDLSPHIAKQRANYLDKMHIYDSISHPSTKLCWLFDLQNGCEKVPRSDNQPAKGNRTKIRWFLKRNQSDQRNPEFHVSTDYFVTFAVSLV